MSASLLIYKLRKIMKIYGKYIRLSLFLSIIYISSYLVINNISQKYIYLGVLYLNNAVKNTKQCINDIEFYFNYIAGKKNIAETERKKSFELENKIEDILLENKILEQENIELKKILNFVQKNELKVFSTKAFRGKNNVFSTSGFIYANEIDVKINDFVLGNNGLLGIINEVSNDIAKFSFITNPEIRMSVIDINSRDTCMTLGVGSKLKLIYVNDKHGMKIGDILVTSSNNMIQNIPVARIESINDNEIYATPISDNLNLDFVGVVSNNVNNDR